MPNDKYFVISPDGIQTTAEPMPIEAAFDEVARFCKQYIRQGFYASAMASAHHGGRIPLEYLPSELYLRKDEP